MNTHKKSTTLQPIVMVISTALIMLLLQCLYNSVFFNLVLQPHAFLSGQWWRGLSGHFVHMSWSHLFVNLLGLGLLYLLFRSRLSPLRWLCSLIFLAGFISAGLLYSGFKFDWYAGFSGILVGLFISEALLACRQDPLVNSAVISFIVIKVAIEQWQNKEIVFNTLLAIPVAVDAHFYGALGGVLFTVLFQIVLHIKKQLIIRYKES